VWWAGGKKKTCATAVYGQLVAKRTYVTTYLQIMSPYFLTSNQSLKAEGAWSSAQASFIAQTKRVDICHQLD